MGARFQIRGLVRDYLPVVRCMGGKTIELLMVSGSERSATRTGDYYKTADSGDLAGRFLACCQAMLGVATDAAGRSAALSRMPPSETSTLKSLTTKPPNAVPTNREARAAPGRTTKERRLPNR